MTKELLRQAFDYYQSIRELKKIKKELNSDSGATLRYTKVIDKEGNLDYVAPSEEYLIANILAEHDKQIRKEIDEEIAKYQKLFEEL